MMELKKYTLSVLDCKQHTVHNEGVCEQNFQLRQIKVKEVLKSKRSRWRKTNGLTNVEHWCTENTTVRVVYLRHGTASKYSFENGKAASNNHVITDVLHDASGLTGHQSEQDRGWKEKRHNLLHFMGA